MYGDPSYTVYFTNATNIVFTNNYVERGYYGYYVIENANPTISGNIQWNNNTDTTPYPNSPPPPTTGSVSINDVTIAKAIAARRQRPSLSHAAAVRRHST
jgi:hypothetical protein